MLLLIAHPTRLGLPGAADEPNRYESTKDRAETTELGRDTVGIVSHGSENEHLRDAINLTRILSKCLTIKPFGKPKSRSFDALGEVSEWPKDLVLKTSARTACRGFESHPHRHQAVSTRSASKATPTRAILRNLSVKQRRY